MQAQYINRTTGIWGHNLADTESHSSDCESIPALLARNAQRFEDFPAYREKALGIWQTWSWKEVAEEVDALALGLLALGLGKGDRVAIIGCNRPVLYWSIVAVQSVGAIPVPLFQDASATEIRAAVQDCGARMLIAEDQEQVDKILGSKSGNVGVEHIFFHDPRGLNNYAVPGLCPLSVLQANGRAKKQELKAELQCRERALNFADGCVLLYTPGTTGKPKRVVLSNANIIKTATNAAKLDGLAQEDQILAMLPFGGIGDFIVSIGQAYLTGFCVNCPESTETVLANLQEIGPSYLLAPPKFFEARLTRVFIRLRDAGRFKNWMFERSFNIAMLSGGQGSTAPQIDPASRSRSLVQRMVILGPLKNALGLSRVKVAYTVGDGINPDVFDFFRALGLNLKQLYGQTEASFFVCQQTDNAVDAGTVGPPSPGVEIKVGADREIYYRSPGASILSNSRAPSGQIAVLNDGWVASGDAGTIDPANGHLRIFGRCGELGKLADGQLFAPIVIENKLRYFPEILGAVVFGLGREFCTAFVNIDIGAVRDLAERNNIAFASYQDLTNHRDVLGIVQKRIEAVNESLAENELFAGCQIQRFLILPKELDADDGEITRTHKLRRSVLEAKYSALIDALYDGSTCKFIKTEVMYEDGRKGEISATVQIRDVVTTPLETRALQ